MKKIILLLLLCVTYDFATAQTILEKGNLSDVFAKAKAEKKMILLIGSATW